jgi:hypothetical protein
MFRAWFRSEGSVDSTLPNRARCMPTELVNSNTLTLCLALIAQDVQPRIPERLSHACWVLRVRRLGRRGSGHERHPVVPAGRPAVHRGRGDGCQGVRRARTKPTTTWPVATPSTAIATVASRSAAPACPTEPWGRVQGVRAVGRRRCLPAQVRGVRERLHELHQEQGRGGLRVSLLLNVARVAL